MNIYKNKNKMLLNLLYRIENNWKKYGLYHILPTFPNRKIFGKMQFKLGYKSQGVYYDDVLKDFIYVYSNGFQKDSFERLKNIHSIKKHKPRIWIDRKSNKYVDYTLCDFSRISYYNNNILSFVVKSRLIQDGFWVVQYSPRKNYQEFLGNIVTKKKLLYFFTNILTTMKKKIYSCFQLYTKSFFRYEPIYFIKRIWGRFKYVFLTPSGYRFMRIGSYWFTLDFFTGLFWIIKGPAKDGLRFIIHASYPLYIYYNNLFLYRWTDDYDVYLSTFIYNFLSEFAFESVESTYIEQKIKYRRSNWYLRRFSKYIVQRFRNSQNRLYNYFQILYVSPATSLKTFGNFFFFYKSFNFLEDFDGSVFKDIDKLSFMEEYSYEDKVLIFKIIVYFLQLDPFEQICKNAMLKKFNIYFKKKFSLINLNLLKISKCFFIFNQFFLEGFLFNNFNYNIYVDYLFNQRRIMMLYQYYPIGRKRLFFFSKNVHFEYIKKRYKKYKKFSRLDVFWKYKSNFWLKGKRKTRRHRFSFSNNRIHFRKLFLLRKHFVFTETKSKAENLELQSMTPKERRTANIAKEKARIKKIIEERDADLLKRMEDHSKLVEKAKKDKERLLNTPKERNRSVEIKGSRNIGKNPWRVEVRIKKRAREDGRVDTILENADKITKGLEQEKERNATVENSKLKAEFRKYCRQQYKQAAEEEAASNELLKMMGFMVKK